MSIDRPLIYALLTSSSWSSIIRGAVIHGMSRKNFGSPLKVVVKSRIARESLGVVCEEPYNEDVHHPDDKLFDNVLQKDVGIRVMKWHVTRVSNTGLCTENVRFLTAVTTGHRATKFQKLFQSNSSNILMSYPRRSLPTYTSLWQKTPLHGRMIPSKWLLKLHGTFKLTGSPSQFSSTTNKRHSGCWSTLSR